MERRTDVEVARKIFGDDFIGYEEISKIATEIGIRLPKNVPEIQFTETELKIHSNDCILILGVDCMADGKALTISNLRHRFGTDAEKHEPCFYNQDWYLKEDFMDRILECKWYLIKKNIIHESRAVAPDILDKKFNFPQAVLCTYVFYIYWFHNHTALWKYDFVWCSDHDHNGDIIYVGKYSDIDEVNKNGFSIHRHLALRDCYGAVEVYN